jgi:hypothetical protein
VINLNLSVDQAQNDSILMNVVRASHSQPLTFVGISKISGSQTSGMSNGLPGFHFGPDLSVSQRQFSFGGNSINNSANGNFDVGALSATREFTKGLLTELTLVELQLMLKQGVARDLMFALAFEAFEFTVRRGGVRSRELYVNDPSNSSYWKFKYAVWLALKYGLNIETRQESNPLWAAEDKGSAHPRVITVGRFCFDPVLNVSGDTVSDFWVCDTKWAREPIKAPGSTKRAGTTRKPSGSQSPDPETGGVARGKTISLRIDRAVFGGMYSKLPSHIPLSREDLAEFPRQSELENISIRIRSLYGVFGYLGRNLTEDTASKILIYEEPELRETKASPLFEVDRRLGVDCFSHVRFNSADYCVPERAGRNTKRTFAVLSQLLALKTQPGDLPFTPTVRISP